MLGKVIKAKRQAETKIVVAIADAILVQFRSGVNALHWCLGRDGTGRCFSVVTLLYGRVQ